MKATYDDVTVKIDHLLKEPGPLPIVAAGDPVLRAEALPYDGRPGEETLRAFVAAMRGTMESIKGAVGLAAPQVGVPLRLAVLATPAGLTDRLAAQGIAPVPFTVLINPSYEASGPHRTAAFEGCLSVSGWQAVVARADRIELTREDERGERVVESHEGLTARIMQHEVDHLRGTLYLDRAEMRSLSRTRDVLEKWGPAGLTATADELGFPLP